MKTRTIWNVAAVSVFLALSAPVLAANPVALATSVTGKTDPAVEMFTELDLRAKIVLDPGAEIEFLHYASYQTVVVRGGTLTFTAQCFLLRRGKIVTAKRAKFPKTVALTGASQIGGIVLRGGAGNKKLRVATAPSFILVGKAALDVESIRISRDGRGIVEAANPGRAFHWPADAPRLEKGRAYLVTLKLRGRAEPKTFNVEVKGRGGKGAITLIRLD
jgi:hypothetical protein